MTAISSIPLMPGMLLWQRLTCFYELIYSYALSITSQPSMNSKSATYTRLAPHCCGSAGNHVPLAHLCFVLTVLRVLSFLVSVFAAVMMIMIPVGNVWSLTEVYLQHVLLLPLTSLHFPLLLFVSHPLIFSSSHVSPASQRAHFDVSCCRNV